MCHPLDHIAETSWQCLVLSWKLVRMAVHRLERNRTGRRLTEKDLRWTPSSCGYIKKEFVTGFEQFVDE